MDRRPVINQKLGNGNNNVIFEWTYTTGEVEYIGCEFKAYDTRGEKLIVKVTSNISAENALDRLTEARKLKSKNWATLPDWILI